jgi:serine/threonine-protein kinase
MGTDAMREATTTECGACRALVPAGGRFCSACGAPIVTDDLPTLSSPAPSPGPAGSRDTASARSAARAAEARFVPGTVLAGRYRIVALLGKGGMGEVYRADDLTLGQPVSLKFLPDTARTEEMLDRFRGEVRTARRVSHRNVCRVYDIGEAEGHHFISMEYVDGEDLASLLKRIGRLPPDKATDVARRICAGLAAAHEKGVLHRDLKPANVMLDREGQVVITDFGLAALADEVPEHDARSGTPRYMAPEQLERGEVTARSDIYALGLVLYELFTGKRAFAATTRPGAGRSPADAAPSSPPDLVGDLDPAVARAILWCLEREPSRRPRSALAVAAALPGGDALAAALEAGETPSPEVVADAGEAGALSPRAALLRLAALFVGLGAVLALGIRASGLDRVGLQSPDALARKARETLARLGYGGPPLDEAGGFGPERDLILYLEEKEAPRTSWDRLLGRRPPVMFYWHRTSPRRMVVTDFSSDLMTPGIVRIWEPPATIAGMVNVGLDARGRLNFLQALPPEREEVPKEPREPDWDALFAAAELDRARLEPADPQWTSLAASDVRVAWTGTWPDTDLPLRVEAAAFHGKPVYFALIGPWTHPYRTQPDPRTAGERAAGVAGMVLGIVALLAAILLARRNYVSGRGDRSGALRLASFVFCLHVALWVCLGHHSLSVEESGLFLLAVANSLVTACVTWLLYLSIEPYVRKHWPQSLISWTRLLAGRLRDPRVGRDLLSGILLGLLWGLLLEALLLALQARGAAPELPAPEYLLGGRWVAGVWLATLVRSIRGALVFFLVLFLLRVLLRRGRLAAIAFVLVFSAPSILASRHPALVAPAMLAVYGVAALAVVRFGLVALAAGILTANLLLSVPVTGSLSSWYAGSSVFAVLTLLALAAWAFHTSLGGRRLWSEALFE